MGGQRSTVNRVTSRGLVALPVAGGVATARLMLGIEQDLFHVTVVDRGWGRDVLQPPHHGLFFLHLREWQQARVRANCGRRQLCCASVHLQLYPGACGRETDMSCWDTVYIKTITMSSTVYVGAGVSNKIKRLFGFLVLLWLMLFIASVLLLL